MNNADIAAQFSLLSKLMDIHGENSFKSKTYSIAAYHIEKLPVPLKDTDETQLNSIKGIGPAIVLKILELLHTGKMELLQEYIHKTPTGVIELLQIKGLGPKKIHIIWKEMGIQSIGELEYACNENRLTLYKGFGSKTQQNVLQSIQFYNKHLNNFLYSQVDDVFHDIQKYLETLFGKDNVLNTGQFRRQSLTIHELEFVIDEINDTIKPKFQTAYPPELLEEKTNSLLYRLNNGLLLRLYTNEKNIYNKQFLSSASDEFIHAFFTNYNRETFSQKEYSSESEIFEDARLPYIPPFLREKENIIDKARRGNLPKIITDADIKGVIHTHSNWSDGINTIEELAQYCISAGFEYLVLSDHSKAAAYANGLTEERILQQHSYIDELNKKFNPFKIFKSIECDILNDGRLDYEAAMLSQFDLVITSIHSNLYMNEDKAMNRLLKAIENPFTTILGHLTGRLLLSREGYPIDHKTIIDACAANHVAIEINANPRRLDIDWKWIDYAMNKNVLLSINPDAHSIDGIRDIKYGVLAAQKGGLTKEYNLSSFSIIVFEEFILKRKADKVFKTA